MSLTGLSEKSRPSASSLVRRYIITKPLLFAAAFVSLTSTMAVFFVTVCTHYTFRGLPQYPSSKVLRLLALRSLQSSIPFRVSVISKVLGASSGGGHQFDFY